LRNTLSQSAYDELLSATINKWKVDIELKSFVEYFQRQWTKSKFCNWQLFKTPVGFAMTNSPIESYNNTIKESFTKRIKHHLKTAVEVFQDVISYESNNGKEFKSEVRVRKYMREQAKTIIRKKQLIATNNENEFLYKHFNEKLGFARINVVTKSCTCHKYLDKGVCKHLIAACVVTQSSLPGLVQMPKKFRIVRRKKIRQYRDDSRDEEQMVAERDEPITVPVVVAEVDVVPVAVAEAVHEAEAIVQIAPKKRGRKPKVINATENASQMGRPPLARDALTISPRITRSSRLKK
jgi:hypothetical protein